MTGWAGASVIQKEKYGRFETLLTNGSMTADNDKTMGRNHL